MVKLLKYSRVEVSCQTWVCGVWWLTFSYGFPLMSNRAKTLEHSNKVGGWSIKPFDGGYFSQLFTNAKQLC